MQGGHVSSHSAVFSAYTGWMLVRLQMDFSFHHNSQENRDATFLPITLQVWQWGCLQLFVVTWFPFFIEVGISLMGPEFIRVYNLRPTH